MHNGFDKLRILLVEDDDLDAELLKRHLSKFHPGLFILERAKDRAEFEALVDDSFDGIISDFNVPGFGAMKALERLKERGLDVPLLVVSGQIGEENAADAMRAGAQDFVMKSNLSRLAPALLRSIRDGKRLRRQIELQKAHEVAVKNREQLLAVICHDLKNPLGSIRLTAQLLHSYAKNSESISSKLVTENSNRICRASERIDRLIHDVLDENKIELGQFVIEPTRIQVADFWNEIRLTFEPLAAKRHVILRFNEVDPTLMMEFDSTRVLQAVSNLLSNALKFSPQESVVEARLETTDEEVKFVVRDRGPGIPAAEAKKVFSKFFRGQNNQETGSGLGLWIASQIVKNHGGEIGLLEAEGGGCQFWFKLPRRRVKAAVSAAYQDEKTNILLVDDDSDLSEVISTALSEVGFAVTPAATVNDAISLLENHDRKYQVIMVDYDLPGENGGALIRWLQSSDSSETPVVLMSAHPDVYERATTLGVSHSLRKPMKLERLLDVVSDCLQ